MGGVNQLGSGVQTGLGLRQAWDQRKLQEAEQLKQQKLAELFPQLLQGGDQQATLGQIFAQDPRMGMQAYGLMQGQEAQQRELKGQIHGFMKDTNSLLQNAKNPEEVQQILQYRMAEGNQLFGPQFNQTAEAIQEQTGAINMGNIRQIMGAKPQQIDIGQYNPRDYTPESFAEFVKTKDPAVLKAKGRGQIKMVAGVPYEYDPATGNWKNLQTAEEVADIEALIAEKRKFAELTGADRAAAIDDATNKIMIAENNVNTMDQMIDAIDRGATTSDWAEWTPTFKEATKEFRNLANQMGLDVISSVTFGALSEAELKLAMQTAVPPLEADEMRQWLINKKAAQNKLIDQMYEYAAHLNSGGSKASWLQKQREIKRQAKKESKAATQQEATNFPNAPKIGTVQQGYMYKGGDPGDLNNWEKQ